ncbi:HTH_48 domain-containing protein [Trichonephila clavipes]|uniref:HTH_48 domain-containing protein n=1 Tax=Trichonephila clavipes TaxID=2585209 RepID=A0A8X6VGW8_TRICX|nr:HTH_48 domain-containing protein [Trichonephila clavipes]
MDAPKEKQGFDSRRCFPKEICRHMTAVYGEHCMSLATVKRWIKRFREGRESCKDDPRPSQRHLADTSVTIAQVDELIRQEWWISIVELVERVNISHGIIPDHIGYRPFCAKWIPKLMNDHQKTGSFGTALTCFIRYHNEVDDFLSAIVIEDESWCYHYEPYSGSI